MSDKQLNLPWMFETFCKVAVATAAGQFLTLDSTWDEVIELKKLRYVTAKPKLAKDGNIVAYVAQKGATALDLINDLQLPYDEYVQLIPSELNTMSNTETQPELNIPAAPVADVAQAPADFIPPAPVADVAVAPATPVAPVEDAPAPVFHAETHEQPATQTADVIGEGVNYAVVGEVERRGTKTAIETGIAYRKPTPATNNLKRAAAVELYPYAEIVAYKKDHPNEAPSFHLQGKQTKDVSGMIKRHAERYEKSDGITFRASKVGADDPQGEGVRVFALFESEAPARRKAKAKGDAATAAE